MDRAPAYFVFSAVSLGFALQIENVPAPRPLTHDLLLTVLQELGATVTRVVIHDLR